MSFIRNKLRKGLGIIVFVFLAGLLVSLWAWERKQQNDRLWELTAQHADEAVARVSTFLNTRMALLRSLQQLLQSRGFPGDTTFRREAAIVYHAVPGFQAVNWIDRRGRIAIIYPVVGNEPALGKDLHQHPDAAATFIRAELTGEVCITPKVRLLQGGLGLATYWPVNDRQGRRLGYVNGVFNLSRIFEEALSGLIRGERVSVEIWADSTLILRAGATRPLLDEAVVRMVRFGPNRWEIRVRPGPDLYAQGPISTAASWLASGLVLVGAVAVLITILDRRQTAYRRARDEARTSEARLRSILEASPYRIYAYDAEFRLLFESRSGGAGGDGAVGQGTCDRIRLCPEEYVSGEDLERVRAGMRSALEGKTSVADPFRVRGEKGEERWVRAVWAPLRDETGEIRGAIGMEMDCTEEQNALQRLRESEEWNRLLVHSLQSMVLVLDVGGRIVSANPAAAEYLGVTRDRLDGASVYDWIHPAELQRFREDLNRTVSDAPPEMTTRYRLLTKSGGEVIVEARWSRLERAGETLGLLLVGTDVTARVRAEKASEASERRFRALFENVPEAVFVFDPTDYRILDVNRVAEERYGYSREEFQQMTILDIRPPEQIPIVRKILESGGTVNRGRLNGEFYHRSKDGRTFPVAIYAQAVELDGKPRVIAIAVDLTERQRAEREREELRRQLFQAQRMEAIGRLAGGIAHDFNNMLTGIMGLASLIETQIPSDQPGRREASEIKQICRHAAELVSKLLAFSRRQIIAPRPISLNDVVRDMSPLLQQVVGENVKLQLDLDPNVPAAVADQAQVEQVVLNLAVNARDAMPSGGALVIRTWSVAVSEDDIPAGAEARGGEYVILSVRDTGVGMDEETRSRVFEPFYTTKGGKGSSGLGLAVVYGIVKQHGGFIELESEPGKGTEFRIYWPASGAEPTKAAPHGHPKARHGEETILVVEDEEIVRAMAVKALRRFGYRVFEAVDAEQALEVLAEHPEVDLIFTDVVMPGMTGAELRDVVREKYPSVKFLFSSGYTSDGVHENFVLGEGVYFLPKPYDPAQLAQKVREVLDAEE